MRGSDRRLIVLVGGPNGAGKSTFIRQYTAEHLRRFELLNADDIAREGNGSTNRRAGVILLARMKQHTEARKDVIIETTLSGRSLAAKIPRWRSSGYRVIIHYIALPDVETSVLRVARRIAAGGHGIPEATLRRRFPRSRANLETIYKPLVDAWYVLKSDEGKFSIEQYLERGEP